MSTATKTPSLDQQIREAAQLAADLEQRKRDRVVERRHAEDAAALQALEDQRPERVKLAERIVAADRALQAVASADVLDLQAVFVAWLAMAEAYQAANAFDREIFARSDRYVPLELAVPGRGSVGGKVERGGVMYEPRYRQVPSPLEPFAWSKYLDQLATDRQLAAGAASASAVGDAITSAISAARDSFTDLH
ncbi:hypothetical protein [Microbacterium panaciterrae]|uniref:Uncharacterized protein n=1 Tax=Microbacterium panaciterrae TaxID=985759 RepID=A0ABP8P9E6_9MICO